LIHHAYQYRANNIFEKRTEPRHTAHFSRSQP
jgi:hypothetical protein